ncbi:ABC transporter ATP-binding protein [Nakamurella alba]|uniref:ABC transporter ATP-binding protein n=1 Tax=Nakamurella alba TaxID=2665158 RepID=UPI003898F248
MLRVRDLDIDFWVGGTWYPAVQRANFDLAAGEVLAIVGESGSGKSTTAMAILGLLPKNAHVDGSIKLGERELVDASQRTYRSIRGKDVAVIFQEPMTALNPVYTIGFQIAEMLRSHRAMSPSAARKRAIELLKMVEIPDPEKRVDAYPHQLSGGQRQRAMIAQSLAMDPKLLIADEPTTALDVTVQAEILKLMRDLKHRIDASIILITHDMGVVADMADRMVVMKDGRIVEEGTSEAIFRAPQQDYTRTLLTSVPHLGAIVAAESGTTVEEIAEGLDVEHTGEEALAAHAGVDPTNRASVDPSVPIVVDLREVAVEYPKRGRSPAFRAVDGFNLQIGQGEVVGLVGESGSGKTTIGRALVGLLPFVEGDATVIGLPMRGISQSALRPIRRDVSFVFQDPGSSLNPRLPVGESIGEPLLLHKVATDKKARSKRVEELLDQVQLPRALRNRYPHELSGGQRQRVGIARALALSPKLLIADEPTSALDVSVQARVLDLFQELQAEAGFACLFISHDLAVIEILCRRIAVLHHGRLVEQGTREQILTDPIEDYTKRLLAAVPVPDPAEQQVRRERRDQLLAAGVGVEKDEFQVF